MISELDPEYWNGNVDIIPMADPEICNRNIMQIIRLEIYGVKYWLDMPRNRKLKVLLDNSDEDKVSCNRDRADRRYRDELDKFHRNWKKDARAALQDVEAVE